MTRNELRRLFMIGLVAVLAGAAGCAGPYRQGSSEYLPAQAGYTPPGDDAPPVVKPPPETGEPVLKLTASAPKKVARNSDILLRVTVGNTGSATARGVELADTLPAGFAGHDGNRTFLFVVGSLRPGETREFTISAVATIAGVHRNRVVARCAEGQFVEADHTIQVE